LGALDPTVQAAIWGGGVALAIKCADVLLGRAQSQRAERDELRDEIKRIKDERDLEVRRRRESEDRERVLRDERDSAETASRMARTVAEQAKARMDEAVEACEEVTADLRAKDEALRAVRAQLAKGKRLPHAPG
jgi:chromosome segregation ATPase